MELSYFPFLIGYQEALPHKPTSYLAFGAEPEPSSDFPALLFFLPCFHHLIFLGRKEIPWLFSF